MPIFGTQLRSEICSFQREPKGNKNTEILKEGQEKYCIELLQLFGISSVKR